MLKTLRTKTKSVMIVVAVAFIAMIVFAWGMDITGLRSRSAGIVGKVNDAKISFDMYNSMLENRRQMMRDNNSQLNYSTERRVHTEVWNELINQLVIAQEIERRHISYSDSELLDYALNNPVPIAYQIPMFQDNGTFSMAKYQAFVSNPENLKNAQTAPLMQYIEGQARTTLPLTKFQNMLIGSLVVSDAQVRERWLMQNEKRTIDWVFLAASRFSDVAKEVSEEEAQAYYNEHKSEYRQDEKRSLDAAFFLLAATPEDSSDVLERAEMIVSRARQGDDFSELANGYSEDPGNQGQDNKPRGGDLGWFGKGRMVPAFEEVVFAMKPGEVSDPIATQFGYHVVKVDSVKYKEDNPEEVDQVKARHVLLKVEPSGTTREAFDERVRAFYDKATEGGDITELAEAEGLQIRRIPPFAKDDYYLTYIGPYADILKLRTFEAKKGDVLPPYYTDAGAYVFQVAEILHAGIAPLDRVRNEVENAIRTEKRIDHAYEIVKKLDEDMKKGYTFTQLAEAATDTKITITTTTLSRSESLPGVGALNPLVGEAFALENIGDCTGPVRTDNGVGIAILTEKLDIDEEKYEQEKDRLRAQILREMQQETFNITIQQLRDEAKIEDNRYMFFNL